MNTTPKRLDQRENEMTLSESSTWGVLEEEEEEEEYTPRDIPFNNSRASTVLKIAPFSTWVSDLVSRVILVWVCVFVAVSVHVIGCVFVKARPPYTSLQRHSWTKEEKKPFRWGWDCMWRGFRCSVTQVLVGREGRTTTTRGLQFQTGVPRVDSAYPPWPFSNLWNRVSQCHSCLSHCIEPLYDEWSF